MEITLIRHGKSLWSENKPITCPELKSWVEKYDCNGVFEEKIYPTETLGKINKAKMVLTSDLKRAIDSTKFLNPNLPVISDPLFRETELPIPLAKLWGLKLNPRIWAVILRCLWLIGYSSGGESFKDAQIRAAKATKLLVECAKVHNNVVLVGHGFFNMLIGKELRKIGWNGRKKPSSKHWNSTTYLFNQ
ncbi:histidine phosphatase family protein [Bacillus sp. FJAT-49736]|uniref:histidine phosphatase family protein n=1 Tax=Bacillus sp. FJAT-49736 TaxID=2833582 RepID=UPI001BC94034|nr:histidine phosphatase family protein [Bacillus sp. FJAT-49736]MBS4172226.1 histidine phosphatase family protein [Bacillus sp. FJAT-49736]